MGPATMLYEDMITQLPASIAILLILLCGAVTIIGTLILSLIKVHSKSVTKEMASINDALTVSLTKFESRFELCKGELARQRKVLRTHLLFILMLCEAVKLETPDLTCRDIIESIKELDNEL